MGKAASLDQVRAAKAVAQRLLAGNSNVVGIGIARIGEGFGLKVNLTEEASGDAAPPADIEGVPVLVEVVGPLRPRNIR